MHPSTTRLQGRDGALAPSRYLHSPMHCRGARARLDVLGTYAECLQLAVTRRKHIYTDQSIASYDRSNKAYICSAVGGGVAGTMRIKIGGRVIVQQEGPVQARDPLLRFTHYAAATSISRSLALMRVPEHSRQRLAILKIEYVRSGSKAASAKGPQSPAQPIAAPDRAARYRQTNREKHSQATQSLTFPYPATTPPKPPVAAGKKQSDTPARSRPRPQFAPSPRRRCR